MKKLQVKSLEIKDVLGVREFNMEPGRVTVLSGRNGSGKTSALESLKSVIGGGNIAKIQHVSDDSEPEVVLVLDGREEHYRAEKRAGGLKLRRRVGDTAGFEDVPQPQKFLAGLFDDRMSNPIDFLDASPKERVVMLLGALPLELDRNTLWNSMGINATEIAPVPTIGLHPLEELAMIRENIFRERTGINRDAKQKAASAEQTRRACPAVLPDTEDLAKQHVSLGEEITEIVAALTQSQAEAIAERDQTIQRSQQDMDIATTESWRRHENWAAQRREEVEKLIAEERGKIEEDTRKALIKANEDVDAARQRCQEVLDAGKEQKNQMELKRIQQAEIQEQIKGAIQSHTLAEQAKTFETEAESLKEKSKQLTASIEALDAYRRGLANELPIPGLEIEGKEIKVNGISFDQLNNAQRIEIAVKIACLRAQDQRLPLVFVDGAEALDTESFDHLCSALLGQNVQTFIGRVEDHELEIKTLE